MSKEIKAIINDLEEERERIRTKCLYPEDVLDCEDLIKIMNYIKQLQQRIDKAIIYIDDMCLCSTGYFDYGDDLSPKHIVDILKGGENNR